MSDNLCETDIEFEGMTDIESDQYQLEQWVKGRSLHNPIRDECCPDFSCCSGEIFPIEIRLKFAEAHASGNHKVTMNILGMALSTMVCNSISDENPKVYIAGESLISN